MGVYLLIIASVDIYYRGTYFIYDGDWRHSYWCQFAGFLSTLSSELSVFTLTVITLDRFITITFPFSIKRLTLNNTRLVMITVWLFCFMIAGLPLIKIDYFANFYGRSGVCLALHITNQRPNGWEYSVFVFLVLNFLSFASISLAYAWMYFVAQKSERAVNLSGRNQNRNSSNSMARRMMIIIMTDFFCWMPIITLGILSLIGLEFPPEVNQF